MDKAAIKTSLTFFRMFSAFFINFLRLALPRHLTKIIIIIIIYDGYHILWYIVGNYQCPSSVKVFLKHFPGQISEREGCPNILFSAISEWLP